jgi:hypothetical protein
MQFFSINRIFSCVILLIYEWIYNKYLSLSVMILLSTQYRKLSPFVETENDERKVSKDMFFKSKWILTLSKIFLLMLQPRKYQIENSIFTASYVTLCSTPFQRECEPPIALYDRTLKCWWILVNS